MKAIDLRKKDQKELERMISDSRKAMSDLKMKFISGKLKNVKEIQEQKKDMARLLTVLREISK